MKNIEEFYKKYNILYVECIEISSQKKEIYGDLNDLPYQGMYTNLLGTSEKINNLIRMVEKNSGSYLFTSFC